MVEDVTTLWRIIRKDASESKPSANDQQLRTAPLKIIADVYIFYSMKKI
jgi:hypothetical protein